ncbi:hypothetical protein [Thiocapsa sp. N5-Cardenillas]|uniref:hypothetical protein n=1 Tax=Thiocapsa sp. N5-Cardenillas TaxID=3137397 RepID=UPI0035B28F65
MPKAPKFDVIASALTLEQASDPLIHRVLEFWREYASRVTVVTPRAAKLPPIKHLSHVLTNDEQPTLASVLKAGVTAMQTIPATGRPEHLVVLDPFVVFKWDAFRILELATKHNLSRSWAATGFGRILEAFDKPAEWDFRWMPFFVIGEPVLAYMSTRKAEPVTIPFSPPTWSGWLATYLQGHLGSGRYHNVTDLDAFGRFRQAPFIEPESLRDMTFNPPGVNYVLRNR